LTELYDTTAAYNDPKAHPLLISLCCTAEVRFIMARLRNQCTPGMQVCIGRSSRNIRTANI